MPARMVGFDLGDRRSKRQAVRDTIAAALIRQHSLDSQYLNPSSS